MADELTPSQFLELDKNHLKGLLLKSGGTTSHTVILARSFNIPTLVGVDIDAPIRGSIKRFISTATPRLWLSQGKPWPVIISKKPAYRTPFVSNTACLADPTSPYR